MESWCGAFLSPRKITSACIKDCFWGGSKLKIVWVVLCVNNSKSGLKQSVKYSSCSSLDTYITFYLQDIVVIQNPLANIYLRAEGFHVLLEENMTFPILQLEEFFLFSQEKKHTLQNNLPLGIARNAASSLMICHTKLLSLLKVSWVENNLLSMLSPRIYLHRQLIQILKQC